ncbi:MAG: hypothetical protein ACLFS7_01075 [Desulfosudaceae bacterium]
MLTMNRPTPNKSPFSQEIKSVPWGDKASWQSVNLEISRLVANCPEEVHRLRALAFHINDSLAAINPVLDKLCSYTCPWCPEPCCLAATVWLDLSDLLRLHLAGPAIPAAQPKISRGETCRYLGARGCCLPRACRPWTCTRYICPTQRRWWRRHAPEEAAFFSRISAGLRADLRFIRQDFSRLAAARTASPETG